MSPGSQKHPARGAKRSSQEEITVYSDCAAALLRVRDRSTKHHRASSAEHALIKSFLSYWRTPQHQEFHKSGSDLKKIFKIRWLHIVGLKKGGKWELSPSYPTMTKEQFDILDSRDLCHTKQVTTEQHLGVSEPSEVSVSACQHWQLSALVLECSASYCQQLPVTGAR